MTPAEVQFQNGLMEGERRQKAKDAAEIERLYREKAEAIDEVVRLRGLLLKSKRPHLDCEDAWYSCPKSADGCANEFAGTGCTCGADQWNSEVDASLSAADQHKETT
jgi:hypothetical protein